jgi:hypothetical protein
MAIGFGRSSVVMMNEAHSGLLRSRRTRHTARECLPGAADCGVRHLAMEALDPGFAETANRSRVLPTVEAGYLAQPDMRAVAQAAVDLGWSLLTYEADHRRAPPGLRAAGTLGREFTNWREAEQARNLKAVHQDVDGPLLVWCGNGHHTKTASGDWLPMGAVFWTLSGVEPFCIDQLATVVWPNHGPIITVDTDLRIALESRGGTAALLQEEMPAGLNSPPGDAYVLSIDNLMD